MSHIVYEIIRNESWGTRFYTHSTDIFTSRRRRRPFNVQRDSKC